MFRFRISVGCEETFGWVNTTSDFRSQPNLGSVFGRLRLREITPTQVDGFKGKRLEDGLKKSSIKGPKTARTRYGTAEIGRSSVNLPRMQRGRTWRRIRFLRMGTPVPLKLVYSDFMARTNININETLIRKAQKLTRLKTKREIVDRALELLVRSEDRKNILRYHGSGIWKGNYKLARRNRG